MQLHKTRWVRYLYSFLLQFPAVYVFQKLWKLVIAKTGLTVDKVTAAIKQGDVFIGPQCTSSTKVSWNGSSGLSNIVLTGSMPRETRAHTHMEALMEEQHENTMGEVKFC